MRERDKLRAKFGGKCAYCGKPLGKIFHSDHVKPVYSGGKNAEENYFPSCPRCNLWKKTFTVDQFRIEIAEQAWRLRRDSAAFRLAEDFETVAETEKPIVFWFEKYAAQQAGG